MFWTDSVVDFCDPSGGAGRENLWPVVHQRKEVSVQRRESDEPADGDRKLGWR